ncbi:unnamed protein product [Rotaria sordida]|uniref:Uncharacterized protein n=1 Tax=Rotaria sordida TaxID=392033 RepID=A0A814CQI4_9BILA|nr:unnamed protein product [Rotaria sordida]CAF1571839.1 unnamed protein product [Rotaria sordida]
MCLNWGCFIKELYDYCTYVPPRPVPPSVDPQPPLPPSVVNPQSRESYPTPPTRVPIPDDLPPSYDTVVAFLSREHYSNNNPNTLRKGGYEYTIPRGWVRVRIQTDRAQSQQKKIFQRWATSYYGTCEKKLEQILRNRFIPLPGDLLNDGEIFSDHSGYEQQWLTSPSINYASDLRYSPIKTFILPDRRGEIYTVQVVLQYKQKPGTFSIHPGRPGLCDIIPADEIEWMSNQRSTLIPYGLMIRMSKRY